MNKTYLEAQSEQKMEEKKLRFYSAEHEAFYYKELGKCEYIDCYHRALIYTLGITENIRNHFSQVYDIKEDRITPRFKNREWLTGTDIRTLKLAFNLFNDSNKCDVSDVFCYGGMTLYYLQAIALRYEVII